MTGQDLSDHRNVLTQGRFSLSLFLCLWPGLPQLWLTGSWGGLGIAAMFSALLSLLLGTTWVWSDWVDPLAQRGAWTILTILWGGALVLGLRWYRRFSSLSSSFPGNGDLFPRVLGEYLQGNWLAAERLCLKLISQNPRDHEALLMQASVVRRQGRVDEALQVLQQLRRLEGAERWELEIKKEEDRLQQIRNGSHTLDEAPRESVSKRVESREAA